MYSLKENSSQIQKQTKSDFSTNGFKSWNFFFNVFSSGVKYIINYTNAEERQKRRNRPEDD